MLVLDLILFVHNFSINMASLTNSANSALLF